MWADKLKGVVQDYCPKGEKHIYAFFATCPPNLLLALLTIGALYGFFMKYYWVGVSNKSVYFLRLNLLGKVAQTDIFKFGEIKAVTLRKSILENVAKFEFTNGRKLALNISKMRKFDSEEALEYLQKQIP
jgi:hypothetical protein